MQLSESTWEKQDLPEEGELKTVLVGRATRLESQFRLTYGMILNLLRVEDLKVPSASVPWNDTCRTEIMNVIMFRNCDDFLKKSIDGAMRGMT